MKKHILLLIAAIQMAVTPTASAQATITSPPTSQTLSNKSFTLSWSNSGASQIFIHLSGISAGNNEIYGGSMATNTWTTFTWSGQDSAPSTLYIRLWSRYGTQWTWRDYTYRTGAAVVVPPQKTSLQLVIDASIQQYQADNRKTGVYGGQCKAYLQGVFAATASRLGIKTTSGLMPVMPQTLAGYYWDEFWTDGKSESAFRRIARALPRNTSVANSMSTQQDAIRTLLLQAKRGDMIQYGTLRSTSQALHTLAITGDVQPGQAVTWADSNWVANTVVANQSKTFEDMVTTLSTDKVLTFTDPKTKKTSTETHPQGATLYRATNLR